MIKPPVRPCITEFIGTFILIFAGCGAIVVNDLYANALGHTGVCLVFGLTVMVIVYALGSISGAHINPAVTSGFLFAGRFDQKKFSPTCSPSAAERSVLHCF